MNSTIFLRRNFLCLILRYFLLSFEEMKSARKTNEWDYFWLSAVEATRPEEELNFLIFIARTFQGFA